MNKLRLSQGSMLLFASVYLDEDVSVYLDNYNPRYNPKYNLQTMTLCVKAGKMKPHHEEGEEQWIAHRV